MILTILLFIAGFSLSSISTVYAVIGLMSIFPAAPYTIAIMGASLEVSKLVIASWLYRNWKEIPNFLKYYFSGAMLVLMFLTSMSIFGYLSKAHMDASVGSGEAIASLQIIDDKINTQKENIASAKTALTQMDTQVNELMSRTNDDKGTNRAITVRKQQKPERESLTKDIADAQLAIAKLQEERAPLATAARKVEAEVGPIKYIANLIYGDNIDDTILEKAVRIVILMIVFVFDPLAVLLLIAANWNLKHQERTKKVVVHRHVETSEDIVEETVEDAPSEIVEPVDQNFPFREEDVFLPTEPLHVETDKKFDASTSGIVTITDKAAPKDITPEQLTAIDGKTFNDVDDKPSDNWPGQK